ncbi:MAG: hypothetical protein PHP86_10365 [Nevskiales bacterium]|nr:hypothetical protein [Nevskiales bacterium]
MTPGIDAGSSGIGALRRGGIRLLALCLLFAATRLLAAPIDDRLLTRVDAYRSADRIDVVIGLTTGLRYVSHAMDASGTVLQVRLRDEPTANGDLGAVDGVSSLRGPTLADLAIEEISSDLSGTIPSVILRFGAPTQVLRVTASPDDRTLTVSLPAPRATQAPVVPPAVPAGSGIFVVNLTSTAEPGPLDSKLVARITGDAGEPLRLYEVRSKIRDVLRYRQRLGFFASAQAAQAVLLQLGGDYPGAWVGEVTDRERDAVRAGAEHVDLAQIRIAGAPGSGVPDITLERLTELFEQARTLAATAELTRAATFYERIAAYPVTPMQQDAAELLGVVREKAGQEAQAKAAYQAYLQQYPMGPGADRVRQRLAALLMPPEQERARIEGPRPRTAESQWDVFGSVYQFYRYDQFQVNDEATQTTRSLLSTDLDANARRRSDTVDLRFRVTGSYDHDFLDSAESEFRASMAYVDLATRDQHHSARLGRQTRTSGGALGRFDGLYYAYRLGERYRANVIGGTPVYSTADGFDSTRVFYGGGLEIGPLARHWNMHLYGVNQTVDGMVDRRAVGTELRYFNDGVSLFGLADYDVYFSEPNILYLIGSGTVGKTTTFSVIADRRHSPLLSLSNALIGQTVTSISELSQTYSESELKQIALDRSPISTSYTVSLSQGINSRFRISGDVTSSKIASMPASGGIDAIDGSGPDWFYNLQLIGTDLFATSDLAIFGVRVTDTTRYSGLAGTLNYRVRAVGKLDLNPRLRVDRRRTDDGRTQWIYAPGVRAVWHARRRWTLEFELAAELSDQQFADTTDKTRLYFAYAGYRYDF